IINGYEDGTFRAGNPVTYEEAVKMLMCLRNWGATCEAETAFRATTDPNARWSYGYIKMANQQGLTKNTNSSDPVLTQPTTRGVVAILAYNSGSVPLLTSYVNDSGETIWEKDSSSGSGTSTIGDKNVETVSGVVTGTYLTKIETPDGEDEDYGLERYEIMVDDELYDVQKSVLDKFNLYELLGQKVKMTYNTKDKEVTAIAATEYSATTIYSGYAGEKTNFLLGIDNNRVQYTNNVNTFKVYETSLSGNIVFNGKLVDDFRTDDLADPDSPYYFVDGVIEIIENGKYKLVKITSYDTYVFSSGNSSTGNMTLLYKESGERSMPLPDESDADYFIFRRNKKTSISKMSELSKFDVLSILESPSGTPGPDIKIVEVTRDSKTNQKVTGVSDDDERLYEIGGEYYQYGNAYWNTKKMVDAEEIKITEDMPDLKRGDEGINIYLDCIGQIAAVATSTTSTSVTSYNYGYLLALRQDSDESDYDLDLYIMEQNGTKTEFGTGKNIEIDGKKYSTDDDKILDVLKKSAEMANEAYFGYEEGEVSGFEYQQPIRFKRNTSKLVTAIDTVVPSDDDDSDSLNQAVPYSGIRKYTSSSGFSSTDDDMKFSVGSSTTTKIFYIPDDRKDYDSYQLLSSSAFTSGRSYHVEAYNLATSSSQKRAGLVLVYKTNDSLGFNYKSPFIIVTETGWDDDTDDRTITGYNCATSTVASTPNKTVKVNSKKLSTEAREALDNISKGDIVRYIVGSDGRVIDLELWLDASDPVQSQGVGSLDEALENRILAIRSDDAAVNGDYYQASFRLAYGTVLVHEDEDKILTVSPTIAADLDEGLDMATSGTGVVAHKYSTSTKIFMYDSRTGVSLITENGFDEIQSYDDADENASIVVTYSTGDTTSSASQLRFVYIIQ
ncbi:MAG: S-layer homology domain-containing protein, partial [Clostridia bacterium]